MPYFKSTGGVKIFYEETGQGFPLVFLHLWPCDHATWMFQAPFFSEFYRVITPDIRGLGMSDKPDSGYSLKTLSEDLYSLMKYLEIEKTFMVGCSLGGSIAQRFAIDHPEMIQGTIWSGAPKLPLDQYIVEESPGKKRPLPEIILDAMGSKGYLHYFRTMWLGNLSYFFNSEFASTSIGAYLIKYLFEERYARLNADPKGVMGIIRAQRQETILGELKDVGAKAAIIVGDGDPGLEASKEQHKYTPGSQFLLIKNSGHMSMMDQAEIFNNYVLDFLRHPVS